MGFLNGKKTYLAGIAAALVPVIVGLLKQAGVEVDQATVNDLVMSLLGIGLCFLRAGVAKGNDK